jgi:type II secretory pathway predicted ATPase ExeA
MYEAFFGLRERPFQKTPDPRFLLATKAHAEALARMQWGIEQGEVVVLTGDIGTGKSLLTRTLIDQLPSSTHALLLTHPRLTPLEFVSFVVDALGVSVAHTTKPRMLSALADALLTQHQRGQRTAIIVDEAHLLHPHATVEEMRLLLNIALDDAPLLSLVLVGQPELMTLLKRKQHRALAQRVGLCVQLAPLNMEESAAYVHHRMHVAGAEVEVFDLSSTQRLHVHSRGVPRLLNTLAQACLLVAFGLRQQHIDGALVDEVWADVGAHMSSLWGA